MRIHVLIVMVFLVLFLFPSGAVLGEGQTKYSIQIGSDGSATWVVSQTLGINASFDTLEAFQNRITLLADAAENITGRDMTATVDSLNFTGSGSYVEAEYEFYWVNFSKMEDGQIVIGDVFQVPGFFSQLYGDGGVYLTYPAQYVVETVLPPPSTRDDSIQLLEWLGTKDFNGGTRIVLAEKSATPGFLGTLEGNAVLIVSLAVIAAGSLVSFYMFRRDKKKKIETLGAVEPRNLVVMESDEEKVVRLIRSSGGSVYQSAITNQFRFSKAKTSQLLAVLEQKGIVRRYKKGREKIVLLLEKKNGEV